VLGAFWAAWYIVGARAGLLWTRRALGVGAALAALGLLGFWIPWALDAMLAADVALLVAVWLDARRAVPAGARGFTVGRAARPGRVGWVGAATPWRCRWTSRWPRRWPRCGCGRPSAKRGGAAHRASGPSGRSARGGCSSRCASGSPGTISATSTGKPPPSAAR